MVNPGIQSGLPLHQSVQSQYYQVETNALVMGEHVYNITNKNTTKRVTKLSSKPNIIVR
jgi:competence transcription factor ComK